MTSRLPLPIKPFRFGIQVSSQPDRASWVNLAKRTEANGFDVLTMPDHFSDQLAPIPALMTAADATTTLRVGALVWDNDYKHPVVLAKELATIDVLSGGRLELGLGAGWMISDYEQSGIPYDRPGVRIDRFIEGLDVIRGCMGTESFSYEGKHYTITNYNGMPKPIQSPCPPILIGGGGKRVLAYAAQHADIIGINATLTAGAVGPEVIATMSAAAVDDKIDIVRGAVGDRIDSIEMNVRAFMVNVTDDAQGSIERLAKGMHVEASMIAETPFALMGPPSKLIEDLLARRERWGFSYIIVGGEDVDSFAPVVAALRGK
ncbi:MAG: TIGR03621 family F420-dependent LLM class oxidoreductase [Ilumatobacteraceae bacterium]